MPLSTSQGERGKHIALSRRLGNKEKSQNICLYGHNIDARQRIDFDKLLKVFQDAVIVTRELSIRFIDIIQDKLRDNTRDAYNCHIRLYNHMSVKKRA
jgi:hypothetical protein